jgi:Tfp pilus assembly protein FimT
MIVVFIICFLTAITIPAFSSLAPDYTLKRAVRTLCADMHLAKMTAIKENSTCRIEFIPHDHGSYRILHSDGLILKTVSLNYSDSGSAVGYGSGNASKSATVSGGSVPLDGISFNSNRAAFNSRGWGSSGYVYLENNKGSSFAIGAWSSGVIVIKKWDEKSNSWE